ncbi:remodeling and spacing factor 1-like isoform X2 [Neocloeon triangulifer]|uniref:remodeling and spacing factor 1-like isoform X2 n=1 Tax=Neocloeon triangulifer TaxID=2078957 RepID=UPI00286F35BD|nr:remodeling and spacing factor 1-like isoform X2 [Neocloeon triangulifer]
MASEAEDSCTTDPNFAVICSFLERFAETCGIVHPDFKELQQMLENNELVDPQLIDLHVKLLRKARKSFTTEKWEKALIKFCHTFCQEDATQIESLGYIKLPLLTKIRLLKALLEAQFDLNVKFKAAINKLTASELRLTPLGRDADGQIYWAQQDNKLNLRVYQEDEDENSWNLVVKDRESLAELITKLSGGKLGPADLESAVLDDDSNQSQDDEDEDVQPDDILLDTGQPEDALPPGLLNGPHKKKKKYHEKQIDNVEEPTNVEKDTKHLSEEKREGAKNDPGVVDDNASKEEKADEVGETKEEPLMVIEGEGNGADCEAVFGEAIEEPVMFFCGTGSGKECDTGNPGENEEEKQPEKDAEKEKTENSPSKTAVWSIDQICGSSKPNNQSSFSMSMMFGNLSKPSFVPSPEKPSFFNVNFAASAKSVVSEPSSTSKVEEVMDMPNEKIQPTDNSVVTASDKIESDLPAVSTESKEVKEGEVNTAVNQESDSQERGDSISTKNTAVEVSRDEVAVKVSTDEVAVKVSTDEVAVKGSTDEVAVISADEHAIAGSDEAKPESKLEEEQTEHTSVHNEQADKLENTVDKEKVDSPVQLKEGPVTVSQEPSVETELDAEEPSKENVVSATNESPKEQETQEKCDKLKKIGPNKSTEPEEQPMEVDEPSSEVTVVDKKENIDIVEKEPTDPLDSGNSKENEPDEKAHTSTDSDLNQQDLKIQETTGIECEKMEAMDVTEAEEKNVDQTEEDQTTEVKAEDLKASTSECVKKEIPETLELTSLKDRDDLKSKIDEKSSEKYFKEDVELGLDKTKIVEVEKKESLTVASALTFDYNPPASPEGKLVIETIPRFTRGRGRPAKKKLGNTAQPDDKKPDTPSVQLQITPGRGRGRGRGRPPGRPKAGRVDSLTVDSDESKGSRSPDLANEKADEASPSKRMSRRIAVIRQKEEEDRKRKEAEALIEMQRKRELELLRQKQLEEQSSSDSSPDSDSEDDYEADIALKKKKKKKKRRRRGRKGAGANPWESSDSSDSSEESDGLEPEDEDDDEVPELKSDHEFSPESDLELGPGEELQPARRARTVTAKREKAQKAKVEEEEDEYRCQKCQSGDQPEIIILCDSCDQGRHITCMKPQMHLVPEGDWYCPPCGQNRLIEKLTSTLRDLDRANKKKSNADLRKQRLAYVGISLSNIIPSKDEEESEESDDQQDDSVISEAGSELKEAIDAVEQEVEEENISSGSQTSSSSESEEQKSEEDEEMYPLRQRRAAASVKYNFQEYDEMIDSAIQDEVELVKGAGNLGKGKDIGNIVNAEEDEQGSDKAFEPEEKDKIEEKEEEKQSESEEDEDDDDLNKAAAKLKARERERLEIIANANASKRKQKKKSIACLDVSSGDDDHASDEDFVGSDSDYEDEEDDDASVDSGDSEVVRSRRKRGASGPVRRSNRARQSRYDKEFIDDSEASDDSRKAKKSKGRGKGWLGSDFSESVDSESEDSDWGRKKKRKRNAPTRSRAPAKKRKKGGKKKGKSRAPAKKRSLPKDSDSDKPVVKKPRPKPERSEKPKSPVPVEKRTTRGKKINYQEIIGSDSDEPKPSRAKARKQVLSDDEADIAEEGNITGKITPNRNGTPAKSPMLMKASPSLQITEKFLQEKTSVIIKTPAADDDEALIPLTLNPPEKFLNPSLETTSPASIPQPVAFSPSKYPFGTPPSQPPPAYQARPSAPSPARLSQPAQLQPAFRGNLPARPRFDSKDTIVGVGRGQYQPPAYPPGGPQPFFYGTEEYYDNFPQEPPANFETPTAPAQGSTEDEVGEFGGLVSYFSSQREDDLES